MVEDYAGDPVDESQEEDKTPDSDATPHAAEMAAGGNDAEGSPDETEDSPEEATPPVDLENLIKRLRVAEGYHRNEATRCKRTLGDPVQAEVHFIHAGTCDEAATYLNDL